VIDCPSFLNRANRKRDRVFVDYYVFIDDFVSETVLEIIVAHESYSFYFVASRLERNAASFALDARGSATGELELNIVAVSKGNLHVGRLGAL